MEDFTGRKLAVGQTVIVASKGSSVACLKRGVIVDIKEGVLSGPAKPGERAYIKIRYEESGKVTTIDGYMWMTNKRFYIEK